MNGCDSLCQQCRQLNQLVCPSVSQDPGTLLVFPDQPGCVPRASHLDMEAWLMHSGLSLLEADGAGAVSQWFSNCSLQLTF